MAEGLRGSGVRAHVECRRAVAWRRFLFRVVAPLDAGRFCYVRDPEEPGKDRRKAEERRGGIVKITEVQREFPRKFRGYDPEAVRAHLEQVAEVVASAEREAARLKAENEGLKSDLGQRYRSEHTVAEALLQAQEVGARVKAEAEAEAQTTVEAAKAEAERIVTVARAEAEARRARAEELAEEAERQLASLRRALVEAVSRGRGALSAGLEALGVAEAWLANEKGDELGGVPEDEEVLETVRP